MTILIVLPRVPYPLVKGDKLRAFHLIEQWAEHHEIILCCTTDSPIDEGARKKMETLCSEVHIFKMNRLSIAWRLFKGIFSATPFQVCYFSDPRLKDKVKELCGQRQIDQVFCQLIRSAESVRGLGKLPKSLDYMDALSLGMKRRKVDAGGVKRWLMGIEAQRLTAYEKEVFKDFDSHAIISKSDREAMEVDHKESIAVIPNGVDVDYFTPSKSMEKYDLVFVGNLAYPPNVDCACYLAQEVLPIIHRSRKDCSLLIAGASASAKVNALKSSHVTIGGWYDDIREAYGSARIFTAPMKIGTGLQNKLLEAMAMEIPAVTSQLANAALGATPGREVLIGDSAQEVAEACILLLDDEEKRRTMGGEARAFVREAFSWKRAASDFESLFS